MLPRCLKVYSLQWMQKRFIVNKKTGSGTEPAGNGVPGGIRTHDLPLRRRTLYPAELRGHGTLHYYTQSASNNKCHEKMNCYTV